MAADKNQEFQNSSNFKTLPIFLGLCILAMGFGGLFRPGEWYASLNLAPWTPPNIVFPIVWSILYILIALAGWSIFSRGSQRLKQLWVAQLIVNAAWSWLFFGQHWVGLALVDIVMLDVLVMSLIMVCRKAQHHLVAWLLMPYLCWITLATTLNAYVFWMN